MGKGKTGGHWRPCNVGSVEAHNERQKDYLESVKKAGLNLYFFPQLSNNNSHWVSSHERYSDKTVAEVFGDMKKLYQQKTGQPPQLGEKTKKSKKTGREYKCAGWSPIREMCVPIKEDTKVEDFDYLKKWAAKYRIEIMRIDLHKDEGYYDQESGDYKLNYHAHVVASFLDWDTGKTVKAGKEAMSEMQTILAISLCMERGERKADTGKRYLTHQEYRGMMEEIGEKKKLLQEADEKLNHVNNKLKRAETKLKGLNTMLTNLEEQRDALEIDIAALEEERDNGNKEAEKKLAELNEQLNQLNQKILERNQQISDAKEQLRQLSIKKHSLQNEYDDLVRQKNKELPDILEKTQREANDTCWELAAEEMKKDYSAFEEFANELPANLRARFEELLEGSFFEDVAQRGEEIAAIGAALFLGYVDAATQIAQSGGGGGGNTSGWGRKKDEDDDTYMRRCCIMGRMMMRPAGRKRGLRI